MRFAWSCCFLAARPAFIDDRLRQPSVFDLTSRSLGPVHLGYCRWCGRLVRRYEFADAESRREYDTTATCPVCQAIGGLDPARPPVARLHAVVVVADDAAAPSEVSLVPFRFVTSLDAFEWDCHHIVRAGAWKGSDPFAELAPAREVWDRRGLQVHVLGVERLDDPLLSARIVRSQVVVCLDDAQVAYFARRCVDRPLPLPAFVDLRSDVPWESAYGAPIQPWVSSADVLGLAHLLGPPEQRCGSALHQCALVSELLTLPAPAGPQQGSSAFWHWLYAQARARPRPDAGYPGGDPCAPLLRAGALTDSDQGDNLG